MLSEQGYRGEIETFFLISAISIIWSTSEGFLETNLRFLKEFNRSMNVAATPFNQADSTASSSSSSLTRPRYNPAKHPYQTFGKKLNPNFHNVN
jgi:hypothetical protein